MVMIDRACYERGCPCHDINDDYVEVEVIGDSVNNKPIAWGMKRHDGLILDVISCEEHDRCEGDYTVPLYDHAYDTTTIDQIAYALTGDNNDSISSLLNLVKQLNYVYPNKTILEVLKERGEWK